MDKYSLPQIAEKLDLQKSAIRQLEGAFPEFIYSILEEIDSKNVRYYSKEVFIRLENLVKLQKKGLKLELIREVFIVMYSGVEVAATTVTESNPNLTPKAMIDEFMREFHQRFEVISKDQLGELRHFMEERMSTVDMIQNDLLLELGTRRDKHPRKAWYVKK